MSKAEEFLKKAAADETLQKALTALMENPAKDTMEKIIALAKANGYEFTAEEFAEAGKEKEGEISDDELDEVAGGVMPSFLFRTEKCPYCGGEFNKLYLSYHKMECPARR